MPFYRPDPTSKFAPSLKANVTTTSADNVYVYARQTLWLAYGLAIAFTLLAVCAGMIALVLNDAAFNNKFSTIVRVGRAAILSDEMIETDGDGTAPLPQHLEHSRLLMKRRQSTVLPNETRYLTEEDVNAQKTSLLSTSEVRYVS